MYITHNLSCEIWEITCPVHSKSACKYFFNFFWIVFFVFYHDFKITLIIYCLANVIADRDSKKFCLSFDLIHSTGGRKEETYNRWKKWNVDERQWSGTHTVEYQSCHRHQTEEETLTIEPRHENTCLCHMRTTKAQINLRIPAVWSAPLLFAAWTV